MKAGGISLSVLELYSRAVVGWSMAPHRRAELVTQAVSMASWQRQPPAGLSMPTERGSQEGANSSRQLLSSARDAVQDEPPGHRGYTAWRSTLLAPPKDRTHVSGGLSLPRACADGSVCIHRSVL